jgi:hypothetical protein
MKTLIQFLFKQFEIKQLTLFTAIVKKKLDSHLQLSEPFNPRSIQNLKFKI